MLTINLTPELTTEEDPPSHQQQQEKQEKQEEEILRLECRSDGRMWVVQGTKATPVRPICCFPWSQAETMISLRNEDNEEVVLIEDPAELDLPSQKVLLQAVEEARFAFVVTAVESIEEESEIYIWNVTTKSGERSFQVKRDEWPKPTPDGGLVVKDIMGDLYHIAEPKQLDENSRKILWAYLD